MQPEVKRLAGALRYVSTGFPPRSGDLTRARHAAESEGLGAQHCAAEVHAIYLASQQSGCAVVRQVLAVAVAGYALSPIDLIPDFIP